ncbi:hypothetical protein RBI21_06780 [Klebsiella pneumoniae]|nr:hypothetical protein RBI21_06780 [Klebsiella pneumoniae]
MTIGRKIIDALPKEPSGLCLSVPIDKAHTKASAAMQLARHITISSAVAYAQAEYDWDHRTGCPF